MNSKCNTIKSILPVLTTTIGWRVRVRFTDGTELFERPDGHNLSLASAQCLISALRRGIDRHGAGEWVADYLNGYGTK